MAMKLRHGQADDNFIHDEESVLSLRNGIDLSYVRLCKSLGERFSRLRRYATGEAPLSLRKR